MVILVVVAIVAIAAVAAFFLMGNGSHLEITNETHTPTSALGFVVFAVTVANTGSASGSATIHCTVSYSNGDSYTGTQKITLDAGQSETYTMSVMTSMLHMGDMSGTYSCRL